MKRAVIVCIACVPVMLGAKVLPFIQDSFEQFVQTTVSEQEQKEFAGYFKKLSALIEQEQSEAKKEETLNELFTVGYNVLEKEHHQWCKRINEVRGDNKYSHEKYDKERADARQFVRWHGAFEKFKDTKHMNQSNSEMIVERKKDGFASQAKTYMAKASKKVGNWFKSWGRS